MKRIWVVLVSMVFLAGGWFSQAGVAQTSREVEAAIVALINTLGTSDQELQTAAVEALAKIGLSAIPMLIETLTDADRWMGGARALVKIGLPAVERLVEILKKDMPWDVRRRATVTLEAIGPAAKNAISVLSETLNDENFYVRFYAACALASINPASVPTISIFMEALDHEDPVIRSRAVYALGRIGAIPGLIKALNDKDRQVRLYAIRVLGDLGAAAEEAIPALLKAVMDGDCLITLMAIGTLEKIGPNAVPALIEVLLTNPPCSPKEEKLDVGAILFWLLWSPREAAAEALGRMGPAAKDAVPALIDILKMETSYAAQEALKKIGTPAVPKLIDLLDDKDLRVIAARILGSIGPEARAAIPKLSQLVEDADPEMRKAAIRALGEIRPLAKDVIALLIEALKDAVPDMRATAAEALTKIGADAVPDLVEALLKDQNLRITIATILGNIGPEAKEAIPELVKFSKDRDPQIRQVVVQALGGIGQATRDVLNALIGALKDDVPYVREAAAEALGKLGAEAAEAVPVLVRAAKDQHQNVRKAAIYALGRIGPRLHDPTSILLILKALEDALEDEHVNFAALEGLKELALVTKDAIPSIIGVLLNHVDSYMREQAALALEKIGPMTDEVVPALIAAFLFEPEQDVRRAATSALAKCGQYAVPMLIETLKNPHWWVRMTTAEILRKIGDPAKAAVPALIETFNKDTNISVRRAIAWALAEIGPEDQHIAMLLVALKDTDVEVRQAAAKALGKLGEAAKDAVWALIEALNDESFEVRKAAAEALGDILKAG